MFALAIHLDLTHVDALTLLVVAMACIPAVQFLTESIKQAAKARSMALTAVQLQAASCAFGVIATEIAAVVKMAVDVPTGLMAAVLGVGVGFAASGHRDYLVAAYKVVLNLTQSSASVPSVLTDPPPTV